jgi:hypothetical protein
MAHDPTLARLRLGILLCVHIFVCCVSLIYVANFRFPNAFNPAEFHISYNPAELPIAVLTAGAFALVASVFVIARFSFGYFAGLYFYTMALSYLWLNCFTDLSYDHRLAGLSVAASAAAFLLPAMFICAPLRQVFVLSEPAFDRMLTLHPLAALAIAAIGAAHNFRFVAMDNIYDFRNKLQMPRCPRHCDI